MGTQSQRQSGDGGTESPPPADPDQEGSNKEGSNESAEDDGRFDGEGYETGVRLVERPLEQQHPEADPLPRSR